jgi:hypothetical protein
MRQPLTLAAGTAQQTPAAQHAAARGRRMTTEHCRRRRMRPWPAPGKCVLPPATAMRPAGWSSPTSAPQVLPLANVATQAHIQVHKAPALWTGGSHALSTNCPGVQASSTSHASVDHPLARPASPPTPPRPPCLTVAVHLSLYVASMPAAPTCVSPERQKHSSAAFPPNQAAMPQTRQRTHEKARVAWAAYAT